MVEADRRGWGSREPQEGFGDQGTPGRVWGSGLLRGGEHFWFNSSLLGAAAWQLVMS